MYVSYILGKKNHILTLSVTKASFFKKNHHDPHPTKLIKNIKKKLFTILLSTSGYILIILSILLVSDDVAHLVQHINKFMFKVPRKKSSDVSGFCPSNYGPTINQVANCFNWELQLVFLHAFDTRVQWHTPFLQVSNIMPHWTTTFWIFEQQNQSYNHLKAFKWYQGKAKQDLSSWKLSWAGL